MRYGIQYISHLTSHISHLPSHISHLPSQVLHSLPGWDRYAHQEHDLFVSRESKTDYYLTDDTAKEDVKMLTQ
jgi:hypothetical protein